MENSKKTFIAGINTDDSFFALTAQDNLDALNSRVVTSSEGKAGSISNVDGTRKIPNYNSFKNTKVIGSYEDATSNNVFYFLVNTESGNSSIYCYKPKEDNIYKVLSDSNLEPSYKLGFNKLKPITGIGYIDDILYWTGVEGKEPFRINVERGISTNNVAYTTSFDPYILPLKKSIITLIRKPPMLPLKITVEQDADRDTSFLKSRSLTFAYRYVYKDGETSVFSPTSYHYPNQDIDDDDHKTSRKIKVDFPLYEAESTGISQDVHKIQYAVKFDKDTSYFIWKEFDDVTHTTEFSAQNNAVEGVITADFYNDVLGFAVDDINSIKLYDTIPYEAEALSIARNRLFLGNIKEGRLNTRQLKDTDINLNIITQSFNNEFSQYDRDRGGKVGFSHASAYQIGLAFFDFAGRTGGVLTNDTMKVITPERGLELETYNAFINFNLNTETANSIIPDWAEYYAIVRTKNLTKDFTITNLSDKVRYYKIDSNGGFSVFVENNYPTNDENDSKGISGTPNGTFSDNEHVTFDKDHEGVVVGLGDLTSYKQGYTYQEGDRIKLITETRTIEMAVTGQEGRYVLCNLVNLNESDYLNATVLSSLDYSIIYEIYSPHKIQPNEFYYEAFNGRIIESGGQRTYSETSGNLIGDVYLRSLKADLSNIDDHFHEGNQRSESATDNPIQGNVAYIDYPIFYGSGQNDLTANTGVGNFTESDDYRYDIKIESTSGSSDTFKWGRRSRYQLGIPTVYSSAITITGNAQTLSGGVIITFEDTTGHTVGDRWIVNGKDSTNPNMDQEDDKTFALYKPPPGGTILQGSRIKIYYKENRNPFGPNNYTHTFEVEYPGSNVTQTYFSLEELFWETSFGTQLASSFSNRKQAFSFRRGKLDNTNGGNQRLKILDSDGTSAGANVSLLDGSDIFMIVESKETEVNGGRDVTNKYSILIDFANSFPYKSESMNPSNDYFLNWIQITGKPNLVPSQVSSQKKTTGIVFSETKIPGSKINGLSKFSALDEKRLDDATGPLRSLKITSKTQSTGSVLLAISENETTGIYLGEQQLQQTSSGGQFLAVSSGVIGTMNTLQGSYGTQHPESIVINEGTAFWFDVKNQTVVRYDSNGLTAIGDNKMKTFFKEKSSIISTDSLPHFVVGTYDDYNSEYIITLPKTGEVTTVLQEDPYYPDTPIIDITNEGEVPSTKIIDFTIIKPWNISGTITIIEGVGTITFNSPYGFTIPSNVVMDPSVSNITITNSSSGGFTQNSGGYFESGSGSLTVSNVFGDVDFIQLQLTMFAVPSSGNIVVSNVLEYTNDTSYLYGSQSNGNTPIRVTGATEGTFPMFEEKIISISNGTATIPCTSSVAWQFGNTNDNSINFTECSLGVCSNISLSRVSTNATAINQSSTTIGYQPGTFNIVINDISENIDSVVIDSRPLKKAQLNAVLFDDITSTSLELNSSIVLNRETATEFGFVYSTTNTSPVIGGSGVTKQTVSDATSMSYNITGLSAETTVYAKAYLISNFGTKYGACYNQATGSASNTGPSVTSTSFSSSNNRFTGTITSNGGSTAGTNGITARGWVYSASENTPVIGESGVINLVHPQNAIASFPYVFTSNTTLLVNNTTYYWRAYAKNDVGTTYGSVQNFTTPDTSVGVGGFTLQSSTVSANGGYIDLDVTKNVQTGIAAGSIGVVISASNQIIESETVQVTFTNTQTVDSVQVYIPANFGGTTRTINLKVNQFTSIVNATGSNTPVSISGTITQQASQYQP